MKHLLATHIFSLRVRQDIKDVREVLVLTEQNLKAKVKYLRARISKELKITSTEEEADFLIGWYDDDFVRLDKIYPNIQRRALFTTLMSIAEADMQLCCRMCHRALGVSMFKKKGRDRTIVQMLAYLKTHLTIRNSKLAPHWERLNDLWSIRNALVHNDGIPNRSDMKPITEFCASTPTIELDDRKRIILKQGSMQMALHIVDLFFSRLIDEIKNNKLPRKTISGV